MTISLLAYVTTISGQLYFPRSYFFTLLQCNYFGKPVTFWERVFLQNSSFFRGALFFKTVTSIQQLFFQNSYFFRAKLLPKSHFLRISSYYTAVTFWNSYLFGKEQLLHSIKFFERATFCEKLIFWRSNNPHYLFFRKTVLSITATFSKELLFHNMLFQKKYNFTATLPFHSCTSCVSVCN